MIYPAIALILNIFLEPAGVSVGPEELQTTVQVIGAFVTGIWFYVLWAKRKLSK